MRVLLTILLYSVCVPVMAQQKDADEVLQQMKRFHTAMVAVDHSIGQYVDDSLSYGHSNGWIENKADFLADLGGKIVYHSFKEDSVKVSVQDGLANVRFVSDVDVSLNGAHVQLHLRVLEVWVKRTRTWKLFARQAIR